MLHIKDIAVCKMKGKVKGKVYLHMINKEERRGSGNRRTGGSLGMEMEDREVKGSLYHYILYEYFFVQFL
jgi:hypothetical protein